MSSSNGIIRIGRKGLKKFAFGDESDPASTPFEVDVVVAFQQWIVIDDSFRPTEEDKDGRLSIPTAEMPAYHQAAVSFIKDLSNTDVTTAEALDFIARLREQYDELATFFRPKSREEPASPVTSEAELRFSVEPQTADSAPSTS